MAAPMLLYNLMKSSSKTTMFYSNQIVNCSSTLCRILCRPLHFKSNAQISTRCLSYVKNNRNNGWISQCGGTPWSCAFTLGSLCSSTSRTIASASMRPLSMCRLQKSISSLPTASFPQQIHSTPSSRDFLTIKKLSKYRPPNCLFGVGNYCGCKEYCSVSRLCWSCNAPNQTTVKSNVIFFCDVCNVIQPVSTESNYFQVMQCEETFDLKPEDLSQTFRSLQRRLHPDKFGTMSKMEQGYSAMQSSEVNKAYSTLLKPLSRGLYLLELNGLRIEEGDAGIEAEFLMEVMETNEALAETKDETAIRNIGQDNAVKLEALLKDLSKAFSKKNYPLAREILMRLKYFSNIDDKVREKLEEGF